MVIWTVKASKSQRKEKERKVGVKATPPLSARFVKFQKQTYCLGATAPSADPIIAKRKVERGNTSSNRTLLVCVRLEKKYPSLPVVGCQTRLLGDPTNVYGDAVW